MDGFDVYEWRFSEFNAVNKLFAICFLPMVLSGCGVTAALQGAGQQIGPAAGAIDSDIYAVAVAKYQAAQVFKAQMDGQIVLPPLPPPASALGPTPPTSTPVPVVVMGTPLSGGLPLGPTSK